MKQRIKNIISGLAIAVIFLTAPLSILPASPAYAVGANECSAAATSQGRCCTSNGVKVEIAIGVGKCSGGDNILIAYLRPIIAVVAGLVGVAIVGAIVVGGILYSSARGNKSQVEKAVNIIRTAIIALLCFIFAAAFINFIVPGGVFGAII